MRTLSARMDDSGNNSGHLYRIIQQPCSSLVVYSRRKDEMNREKMFFFSFLEGRDKRKTRLKAFLGEHVKSAEKTKEKKNNLVEMRGKVQFIKGNGPKRRRSENRLSNKPKRRREGERCRALIIRCERQAYYVERCGGKRVESAGLWRKLCCRHSNWQKSKEPGGVTLLPAVTMGYRVTIGTKRGAWLGLLLA